MHQTLEVADRTRTRRQKPAHRRAQRDVASNAPLTRLAACDLDLPTLSPKIATTVEISVEADGANPMPESALHLAIAACKLGLVTINPDATASQCIHSAATAAIEDALASLDQKVRWWTTVEAAEHGPDSREGANGESDLYCLAKDAFVIEFTAPDVGPAAAALRTESSAVLNAFESVCPGFTCLLYTVLDRVDMTIWPIITPRTLWSHTLSYADTAGDPYLDSSHAYSVLDLNWDTDLAKKYGHESPLDMGAHEAIQVFDEEINGTLPSFYRKYFGTAAMNWRLRHPDDFSSEQHFAPAHVTREEISWAMANMACRPWCPTAPKVLIALQQMHRISLLLCTGAGLANGTNLTGPLSMSAVQLWPFDDPRTNEPCRQTTNAFARTLDDAACGAQEAGEAVDATGWAAVDCSSTQTTLDSLDRLRQGCEAFNLTMGLINTVYSKTL